jgi:hypothetical protein
MTAKPVRRKSIAAAQFASLLLVALALAPGLAHLLELPNKIGLEREAYLLVQQSYRGWALLGIVIFGALLATLWLTILVRRQRHDFLRAAGGFVCIVGAQAVFWLYTYPANVATDNWTRLPDNWRALREQWEVSHAAGAVLTLAAFVLIAWGAVASQWRDAHADSDVAAAGRDAATPSSS